MFAADSHNSAEWQFEKAKFLVPSYKLAAEADSDDEAQEEGVSNHQKKLNCAIRAARA